MNGPELPKGFNWQQFAQVKLGAGVIGKTVYVAGAVVGVCGLGVWALPNMWLKSAAVLIAAVWSYWYLKEAFKFAYKHPEFALLEGAHLVNYKQLEMAAKGIDIKTLPGSATANIAPPLSITQASPLTIPRTSPPAIPKGKQR